MGVVIPGQADSAHRGLVDFQGVDLGNGLVALLTIVGTRTRSAPAYSAASEVLLAANAGREVATITNNGGTNLWVQEGAGPAVVGAPSTLVAPGATYAVTGGYRGDVVGIWEAGGAGSAAVSEIAT